MANECVVAVYDSFDNATKGIRALDEAGFSHDQVSLVTTQDDVKSSRDAIKAGDQAEEQTAKGAVMGGLLGLLLGAPLLAIPGVGPLLIAGPLATGATGGLVGGFLGAMSGWGVQQDHVARYQQQIRDGKTLLVVVGEPRQVAEGARILQDASASDVNVHAPTSADQKEITN